jgi:hypothetical protein
MKKRSLAFSYFDIIDACGDSGCPFCRLADKAVDNFLASIIHESVNDPDTRAELRQTLGFCRDHAWRLQHTGAGSLLSIAIIYQDVLNTVNRALAQARFDPPRGLPTHKLSEAASRQHPSAATQGTVRSLKGKARCLACDLRDEMDVIALIALTDALGKHDDKMLAALQTSDGLCLPHLRRAFELIRNEVAFKALAAISQEKLAGLAGELGEFIRKHDYRFQNEPMGHEADSWQRALSKAVGEAPGSHTRSKKKF